MVEESSSPSFVRDKRTLLTYSFASYIGFYLIALGVVMPNIRDELQLSYAVAGLHFSALCVGGVISALGAHAFEQRFTRTGTVWLSVLIMTTGVVLLLTGRSLSLSLAAAFLIGAAGVLIDVLVQASAADSDEHFSASVVSESNASFTLGSLLAPAVVAAFVAVGFGWRWGLFLWLGLPLLLAAALRNSRLHEGRQPDAGPGATSIGRGTWSYVALCMAIVASEWTISFWGVTYLRDLIGLKTELAAACMTGFFVAMLCSRLICAKLVRERPVIRLLLGSLALAMLTTTAVWLAPVAIVAILAFVLAGFAIGPLFPLAMSLAVSAAPAAVTRLSARIQAGNNVAILIAPLALATVADQFGLRLAFGVVPIAVLTAVALALMIRKHASPTKLEAFDA